MQHCYDCTVKGGISTKEDFVVKLLSKLILEETTMKILLIDDDPGVLISKGRILEALGHEVVKTTSATTAIALLYPNGDADTSIDAVITDMRMEGMTGLELLLFLKLRKTELLCLLHSGEPTFREQGRIEIDLKEEVEDNFPFARFHLKMEMGYIQRFLEEVKSRH